MQQVLLAIDLLDNLVVLLLDVGLLGLLFLGERNQLLLLLVLLLLLKGVFSDLLVVHAVLLGHLHILVDELFLTFFQIPLLSLCYGYLLHLFIVETAHLLVLLVELFEFLLLLQLDRLLGELVKCIDFELELHDLGLFVLLILLAHTQLDLLLLDLDFKALDFIDLFLGHADG